jgi:AcrR family transcriptional regulator
MYRPVRTAMSDQIQSERARSAATAHGELSREKILSAAIALFSERGYAGTSVADVCERAGVVKTALYWHFESKEGLLDAALARVAEAWIEQIRANVEEASGVEERCDRFIAGLRWLVVERSETLMLILGAILERAQVNETTRANLHELFSSARGAIVEVVRETLGRDVPDCDLIAETVLSFVHGIALCQRLADEPEQLERRFEYLKRLFMLAVFKAATTTGGKQ